MSEPSTYIQQAEAVRRETIALLENLTGKVDEFGLPEPPETLERYRRKLVENAYKVLLVGEAQTGKSTFVNALVGREVVPQPNRIAVSQVFNVRSAEREAYRLRFEDGSAREVAWSDLPRYHSRVLEGAGQNPRLDQIIRWVEIDVPAPRFLPEGISFLDIPSFGGLHAFWGAEIARRYVPVVDAVIFMLESYRPVVHADLELIEEILTATSNIFFIQTKIDQLGDNDWREIQRRNQEILQERFGDRLADTRVWPFSSVFLLDAAAGSKYAQDDLEDSRYEELETALRAFLLHTAGWSRIARALLVAGRYQAASRRTLSGRLGALAEDREERGDRIEQTKRLLAGWDAFGEAIENISERLGALDHQPDVSHPPRGRNGG